MQLSQQNQTMNLSLTQAKNNLGNSKIWEVSKQHQFNSAKRINSNGQDQTSKEIIEKFTQGLDRQTKMKEPFKRSILNSKKNTPQNLITKDVSSKINSESKSNFNLNNNIHRSTYSKLNNVHKHNIPKENKIILNLNGQKINKNKQVKLDSALIVQQADTQKNKLKNKKSEYLKSNLKRNIEIQEAGHKEIVHSINDISQNHESRNETKNPAIPLELTKIKLDSINRESNKDRKSSDSIENNSIDINYHEDNSFSSNSEDSRRDFKNTLIQLTEHFNTKIKGEITGNYSGEFEIKSDFGQLSINMKRINNQLTIIINSQSIDELQDQITNIEESILDKIPELDMVTILTNYEITNNNLTENKLNNEKQINKAQINQDSFFNLNYLA